MHVTGFFQVPAEVLTRWRQSTALTIIEALFQLTWYLIVVTIVVLIALMLARFILNFADVNPFTRPVIWIRRLTDPFINPIRRALAGFGIQPNGAPLIAVLLALLIGYCVFVFVVSLLDTAAGVYISLLSGTGKGIAALIGYILYGLLSLYSLMIIVRIVLTWGHVSYSNRAVRLLINATDPILVPLRRSIPPLGMFDISPIVAFIVIWLLQKAIGVTLLNGWPVTFVA